MNDLLGRPLASEAELDRRSSEVDRLESLADKARSGQVATAPKEAAPVMLYVTDQFAERKRLEDIPGSRHSVSGARCHRRRIHLKLGVTKQPKRRSFAAVCGR